MKDKVKFDISNGESFFADEAGVIHNPLKIIMDFRSVTPRVDMREFQTLVLKHNVVVMDPYTAKNFSDILKKNITNYEKQYGKIKMPESLKEYNKKSKSKSKGKKESPTYFG